MAKQNSIFERIKNAVFHPEGRSEPATDREYEEPAPQIEAERIRQMQQKAPKQKEVGDVFEKLADATKEILYKQMVESGVVERGDSVTLSIHSNRVTVTMEENTVSLESEGPSDPKTLCLNNYVELQREMNRELRALKEIRDEIRAFENDAMKTEEERRRREKREQEASDSYYRTQKQKEEEEMSRRQTRDDWGVR